jgi:hypothetical protein
MIINGGRDGPGLGSDAIVEPAGPQDLITLIGFLGDPDGHGRPRLFVDSELTQWLDIGDADIIDRRRIPDEQDTHGGRSVLLVKRGAVLTQGEVTIADAEAAFLGGGDARALRCEPDEYTLVRRPPEHVKTKLLTPPGPICC